NSTLTLPSHNTMLDRRATFWAMYIPPLLWLGAFFLVPLLLMAAFSFRPNMQGNLMQPWEPSLRHYENLFSGGSYWGLLWTSVFMALIVAVSATVLAYPVAYFLAMRAGRKAGIYLVLLLVPFWTSYLLRVMAWKIMLGSDGVINSFLSYVGLVDAPLTFLLYNRFSVVLTLIYVWIPFVALPILAALQRIDGSLLEAASDLGASPAARFWRVTLPLSAPGAIAGFFMVFIPTVGEYVTPLLVGGSRGSMYGNIIQDFFTKAANWPLGSALSMVMLVGTLLLVGLAVRLVDVRRLVQ
ncbi:MAG: ABC transporter permease, partial [Chloroflexota bacterium]|nr:ABC transporter permease [Chloroflexota bacterium]